MFEITVEDKFSAAHRLIEYSGDCENLHGHNWKVEITFTTLDLDATGLGIDFRIAKTILRQSIKTLDHIYLNDLAEFKNINPTCENIASMIYLKASDLLLQKYDPEKIKIDCVTVCETPNTKVTYRPEESND